MRHVIVVGAGPAGTATAKRCAEHGLNPLILERHKLPRDKVCSGMVMGPAAHALIKQEFGDIPDTILTEPYHLKGYIFHVPGVGDRKLDNFTLLTWRRDLDYWMNQKALAKGVEIWQGARVIGLGQRGQGYSVEMEKDGGKQEVETRFVVGADGTASIIRKLLFPELKIQYRQIYQECYPGNLDLDREYFHWFYPVEYKQASSFTVHHKGEFTILEVAGRIGQVEELMKWARNFLAENHRFDARQKPIWRRGCRGLRLQRELLSHSFLPAKANALLVGDAGGFQLPVSGEGIGTAIRSGLLAANSIVEALETGGQADKIYLTQIEGIISIFKEIYPGVAKITEEVDGGGHSLPEVLRDAYSSTLRMF